MMAATAAVSAVTAMDVELDLNRADRVPQHDAARCFRLCFPSRSMCVCVCVCGCLHAIVVPGRFCRLCFLACWLLA
jgi:hypothetical protein